MPYSVFILSTEEEGNEEKLYELFPAQTEFNLSNVTIKADYHAKVKECRHIQAALTTAATCESKKNDIIILIWNEVTTDLKYEGIHQLIQTITEFEHPWHYMVLGGWGEDCSSMSGIKDRNLTKIVPLKSIQGINAIMISPAGRDLLLKYWTSMECLNKEFPDSLVDILQKINQTNYLYTIHPKPFSTDVRFGSKDGDYRKMSSCLYPNSYNTATASLNRSKGVSESHSGHLSSSSSSKSSSKSSVPTSSTSTSSSSKSSSSKSKSSKPSSKNSTKSRSKSRGKSGSYPESSASFRPVISPESSTLPSSESGPATLTNPSFLSTASSFRQPPSTKVSEGSADNQDFSQRDCSEGGVYSQGTASNGDKDCPKSLSDHTATKSSTSSSSSSVSSSSYEDSIDGCQDSGSCNKKGGCAWIIWIILIVIILLLIGWGVTQYT